MEIKRLLQGDKIQHIKSGGVYTYLGKTKLKLNDEWVEVRSYYDDIGDVFHRFESDFDGFRKL